MLMALYLDIDSIHLLGNSLLVYTKNLENSHFFFFFNLDAAACLWKLTLLLLNTTCPVWEKSVDPDQLASEEANWFGSALFFIKYVNFYQKPGSNNLIGWRLEVGVAS